MSVLENIHEVVYTETAADFYGSLLESTLSTTIASLSNVSNVSGNLDRPIEILKRLGGKQLYNIMNNHVKNSDDKWKVICHGDLWINNLMFHYHNEKVKHVKLVDLQTIRYSNLTCDILMLLYSSTEGSMRRKHMDDLIQVYRESLINNLREYLEKNYRDELATFEKDFTIESIKEEMAVRSLYGLGTSLWVMPAVTFVSLSPDLMNALRDQEASDDMMMQYQPMEYHKRVKEIVEDFYDQGFLKDIFINI